MRRPPRKLTADFSQLPGLSGSSRRECAQRLSELRRELHTGQLLWPWVAGIAFNAGLTAALGVYRTETWWLALAGVALAAAPLPIFVGHVRLQQYRELLEHPGQGAHPSGSA